VSLLLAHIQTAVGAVVAVVEALEEAQGVEALEEAAEVDDHKVVVVEVAAGVVIPVSDSYHTAKVNLFKHSQLGAVGVADHKPILSAGVHQAVEILA